MFVIVVQSIRSCQITRVLGPYSDFDLASDAAERLTTNDAFDFFVYELGAPASQATVIPAAVKDVSE